LICIYIPTYIYVCIYINISCASVPKKLTRVAAPSPRASLGRRTVCGRTEQLLAAGFVRSVTKLTTKVRIGKGYLWGSFLIAAAALKTPTRNGYNAQGVNLKLPRVITRGYRRAVDFDLIHTPLIVSAFHTAKRFTVGQRTSTSLHINRFVHTAFLFTVGQLTLTHFTSHHYVYQMFTLHLCSQLTGWP